MTFKQISARYLEPASQWIMILGIVALCQPWSLILHRYGVTIILIGLIGFTIFSKIKPRRRGGDSAADGRDRPQRHREVFRRQLRHPEAQPRRSRTRSSSCCSARRAAARRRRCAPSPGSRTIDSGDILIDGKPVQTLQPGDRDIAFVFQLFALYPHLTAYENIAFPLRATRESRDDGRPQGARGRRGAAASSICWRKRPSHLSGGDMQRVAIGRALVRRPKAMLMDEPIGALDAKLREDMRAELKRLHLENDADHGLRHPRPGRGDVARRPHRRHERGRAAAGRHAERGLPAPGQPVRRPVRRQPGDEHRRRPTVRADGGAHQRRRSATATAPSTFPRELRGAARARRSRRRTS